MGGGGGLWIHLGLDRGKFAHQVGFVLGRKRAFFLVVLFGGVEPGLGHERLELLAPDLDHAGLRMGFGLRCGVGGGCLVLPRGGRCGFGEIVFVLILGQGDGARGRRGAEDRQDTVGSLAVFGVICPVVCRRGDGSRILGMFVLGELSGEFGGEFGGGGRRFGLGHDGADALKLGRDAVGGGLHPGGRRVARGRGRFGFGFHSGHGFGSRFRIVLRDIVLRLGGFVGAVREEGGDGVVVRRGGFRGGGRFDRGGFKGGRLDGGRGRGGDGRRGGGRVGVTGAQDDSRPVEAGLDAAGDLALGDPGEHLGIRLRWLRAEIAILFGEVAEILGDGLHRAERILEAFERARERPVGYGQYLVAMNHWDARPLCLATTRLPCRWGPKRPDSLKRSVSFCVAIVIRFRIRQ